jgi:hypothetical protein
MKDLVAFTLMLTLSGCAQELRQSNIPPKRNRVEWDVSENRDAAAFPWYDFDPDFGAIDDTTYLVFKFDAQRQFEGNVELITFSRADDTAPVLQSLHINLPSQTAAGMIETLRSLATSWGLGTERLDRDTEEILSGTDYRGVILYERHSPTIDVSIHSSFNDQCPYSISIEWYWGDVPQQIGEREGSVQVALKSKSSPRPPLPYRYHVQCFINSCVL